MISTTILSDTLGGAMLDSMLNHLARFTPLPRRLVPKRSDNPLSRVQCYTSGRMTANFGTATLILNRAFTPPPHFVT